MLKSILKRSRSNLSIAIFSAVFSASSAVYYGPHIVATMETVIEDDSSDSINSNDGNDSADYTVHRVNPG